jgi:hypothetical protein
MDTFRWRVAFVLVQVLAAGLVPSKGHGQVALPGAPRVQLPDLAVADPGAVTLPLDVRAPRIDARRLRVLDLHRAHRDRLALDPAGELVVRGEVLAQPSSAEHRASALESGFRVLSERTIPTLDLQILVLEPPTGWSLSRAVRHLRRVDPDGSYDFHHVYAPSGEAATETWAPVTALQASPSGTPAGALRVGLIDGGVAAAHPWLGGVTVGHHGCNGRVVPSAHGTAIASLLAAALRVANGDAGPGPLAIAAADVYCGEPTGGAVATVIDALAWLREERVAVINVSLVGPRNALLERAVSHVLARGHLVVAAVGNDGPAAAPLYPAAQDGVVGVTAVDSRHRVLVEAGRGGAVDFAALGAEVRAAALPDGVGEVRGTSFATPVVTALLANQMPAIDARVARSAVDALVARAADLGGRGRDDVYGHGLLELQPGDATTRAQRVMSNPDK